MTLHCVQYNEQHRPAVRELAGNMAVMGQPIETLGVDRDLIVDLSIGYYIDHQSPEWTWVIELDGRVVGYLMGCPDTAKQQECMNRQILPKAIWGTLQRRTLFQYRTAAFFMHLFFDLLFDRPRHGFYNPNYPAHAHWNVMPEGRSMTAVMVTHFVHALRRAGVHGMMAEIWAENTAVRDLLLAHGFQITYTAPLPGMRRADGSRYHELILIRKL